ncbi:hypothetical protein HC026_06520 [Lactobacillus sp. LC28-10]|uniref:Uncharacterized protein n=1 Tax=Secundilactobacillus angelensis TaxID=2722706 RepID=A0ABX1KZ93_9LACO|nr:hypothetical protein [Secundilactobacillus angelensis]MCH5461738.1 hypothetical protein [Secundilactobacillus angelensis]NLR18577.1 hypothetical protein [Secundilactobacillus angelensis]
MTNKLLEIYLEDDDESFIVGSVVGENPHQLLIISIDDNGQVDSVEIINHSRIAKIVTDSAYLDFCQSMTRENQAAGIFDPFQLATQLPHSWQTVDRLLAECQGEQRLISLVTAPEVYAGRVSMISEHQIGLQLVDFESVSFGAPTLIDKADVMVIDYVSRQNYYVTKYWKSKGQNK